MFHCVRFKRANVTTEEFVIQHVSREAAPGKPDSNDTSKVDLPNLLHGFISCPSPQAPEPLLPNYGEGRILPYYLDIAVSRTFELFSLPN